jgi:hypothetical protein
MLELLHGILLKLVWMLKVLEMPGEVSKLKELLFLLLKPPKMLVDGELLLKEFSMPEFLVWIVLVIGIMKPLPLMSLLHPIRVLFLVLNLPYLVTLEFVILMKDKKLSKLCFVLFLMLSVWPKIELEMYFKDTVESLVPFQAFVLQEDY